MSKPNCETCEANAFAHACPHYIKREEPTAFEKAWEEDSELMLKAIFKTPLEDSVKEVYGAGWKANASSR